MIRKLAKSYMIFILILTVTSAVPMRAGESAQLSGRICSPDRCGIQGVAVSFRETTTGRTERVMTGLAGAYRAEGLAPGTYDIMAEAAGFEPSVIPSVRLGDGESRVLDFELSFSSIQEVVTVIGAAPRGALQAAEARESAARDLGEALTRINGIWKVRKGGIANDVVLRGFPSQDINVLIDGERIYGACPNHMDPAAFHVDFAEVDRVETSPGPFDIRNQGSLGGLLNVVTRNAEQGFHGGAVLASGAYGFVNPSANVSYSGGRFSALGGFSYRRSKPFADPSDKAFTEYANYRPGMSESDAFRAGTAWGKVSFSPRANHLLQAAYTRQEADHVLYPYLQMDAVYDNTDRLNLGYQIAPRSGPWTSVRLQTYATRVRHWMTDAFRLTSAGVPRDFSMGTFAATSALGAKLEAETARLSLGVEAYSRGWRATTELAGMQYKTQYSIPDVATDSLGAYADYRLILSDRLNVSAGLRLDYIRTAADGSQANTDLYFAYNATRSTERTDVMPSGHVLFVYNTPFGLSFRAGLGHTVRAPDARERYFALKRMGTDWVGNPDLDPSRNTGLDASVSYRAGAFFLSAGGYYNDVRDYIAVRNKAKVNTVAGVMNSKSRSYANVDARIYGTELQAVVTISRTVSLSSVFSMVRGTQTPDPANGVLSTDLAEIPPFSSRSVLRFDNGLVWGELEGVIAGAQNRVDTSLLEEPTPGYEMANLRLGVNIKGVRIWAALNNAFDRRFVEHLSFQRDPFRSGVRVYEPGRNFFLNVEFRI